MGLVCAEIYNNAYIGQKWVQRGLKNVVQKMFAYWQKLSYACVNMPIWDMRVLNVGISVNHVKNTIYSTILQSCKELQCGSDRLK